MLANTGEALPEVRIERLAKRFGTTVAVDEVSFTVEDASMAVLLGPSGCGKSTTLRLVAGLETASGGRILVDGKDVTPLPPPARGLAMVFQSYALFPHLDVARNITFGLEVRGVPKAERAARLREAAALRGLEGPLALENGPEGAVIPGSSALVLPDRAGRDLVSGLRLEAVRLRIDGDRRAVVESVAFFGAGSHLARRIGT